MKSEQWMQNFVEDTRDRFERLEDKQDKNHNEVNTKLDTLLAFKWQLGGGMLAVSVITGFIVQIILKTN